MIDSHILSVDVSDHAPMITRVKQNNAIITCSNVVVSRLFNETNLNAFRKSLVGCNWDHVYNIKTVDEAFAAFNDSLFSKFSSRNKLKLYKDYMKRKINKDVYVRYQNLYATILRAAKLRYYNDFFLENKKCLSYLGANK